jgi:excisionase family DNA binding protein
MTILPFERPPVEPPAPGDEPLTLAEVCVKLKIKRTLLYKVLKSGELRSFTIGRKRFALRSEVDRYQALRAKRSLPPGGR